MLATVNRPVTLAISRAEPINPHRPARPCIVLAHNAHGLSGIDPSQCFIGANGRFTTGANGLKATDNTVCDGTAIEMKKPFIRKHQAIRTRKLWRPAFTPDPLHEQQRLCHIARKTIDRALVPIGLSAAPDPIVVADTGVGDQHTQPPIRKNGCHWISCSVHTSFTLLAKKPPIFQPLQPKRTQPITPMHFGLIPLLNRVTRRRMNEGGFVLANVASDIPVVLQIYTDKVREFGAPQSAYPFHALHNNFSQHFGGALLLGLALGLLGFKSPRWWLGCMLGTHDTCCLRRLEHCAHLGAGPLDSPVAGSKVKFPSVGYRIPSTDIGLACKAA